MTKRIWALSLAFWMLCLFSSSAFSRTLGPVSSYDELIMAVASAQSGDTVLLSGEISAGNDEPLSSAAFINLKSET